MAGEKLLKVVVGMSMTCASAAAPSGTMATRAGSGATEQSDGATGSASFDAI